jgi:hypothetical protein
MYTLQWNTGKMNRSSQFCSLVIQYCPMFYHRRYTQNNCVSTPILGQNNFTLKVEAAYFGYQSATLHHVTAKNMHFSWPPPLEPQSSPIGLVYITICKLFDAWRILGLNCWKLHWQLQHSASLNVARFAYQVRRAWSMNMGGSADNRWQLEIWVALTFQEENKIKN